MRFNLKATALAAAIAVAALKDASVTGFKSEFFSNAPLGKIYSSAVSTLKPAILGPKSASINTSFTDALATVAQGKKSADDAWDAAIAEIKKNAGPSK